jgi:hypothetical protein
MRTHAVTCALWMSSALRQVERDGDRGLDNVVLG